MRIRRPAALAVAAASFLVAAAGSRDLPAGTPDATIRARAARAPRPVWQVPLGASYVEDLRLAGPDRLVAALRSDERGLPNGDVLLIDTSDGRIVWRYARARAQATYTLLIAGHDVVLFRADGPGGVSLEAIDAASGARRYAVPIGAPGARVEAGLPGARLLVTARDGREATVSAVALSDGTTAWRRTFAVGGEDERPAPVAIGGDVFTFYGAVRRLAAADGGDLPAPAGLAIASGGAQPQDDGDGLLAITSDRRLVRLRPGADRAVWSAALPPDASYASLQPGDAAVFLLGSDAAGSPILTAIDRETAAAVWTWRSAEPAVSNVVESGDRVLLGTPTRLVALDARSGREAWSAKVTDTGRIWPVRLRMSDDRVVFLGELVIAGFDARTGKPLYRHGFSPVSNEASLDGLDASIPRFREEVEAAKKLGKGLGLGSFHGGQASRYQDLAATYRARASSSWSRGDYGDAWAAGMQRDSARRMEEFHRTLQLVNLATDAGLAIGAMIRAANVKTAVERQELFRSSILKAYVAAESEEYAYRPCMRFKDVGDSFTVVAVVHLASGRRRDVAVSPSYLSYGLWNVVDFDRGVLYHHGLGLDPGSYAFSEPHVVYPYGKVRTLESRIVAVPLPR